MADNSVMRLGQVNQSGDVDALFLKVFAGEVLAAFAESNVYTDKTMIRTISNGKSAQFPVTGKFSAGYHTPGAEITGTSTYHNEKVITIDDLLIAHTSIASIDEAKSHFDVRSIYSQELGRALARSFDKNVAQVAILAARASANVTGGFGGSALNTANVGTDGDILAGAIFSAAQKLDEKDVAEDDRYAMVKPAQYYLLVQTTKVINRDWGGSGVYADGKVLKVAGVSIVKSNNVPVADVTTGPTAYRGAFNTTVASVIQKQAVGTVKLLDLAMESEYSVRRQSTLMVAKYAMGHGVLRPECAVEIRTADPA